MTALTDLIRSAYSPPRTASRSAGDELQAILARMQATDVAKQALAGLSDKDKVHFALALLMRTRDPDAVSALRHAANQLCELSNVLIREAFEQECG